MVFGRVNVLAATMILPLVAPGFSGSNVTMPLTPLAVPLMASSGASTLNAALLTPLGSLKSKLCGAARSAVAKPNAARSVSWVFILGWVLVGWMFERGVLFEIK